MLARTKKVESIVFFISIISFILMNIGFLFGGRELLFEGYINEPAPAILMFVTAGMFIMSLLLGIGFNGIRKDIADELRIIRTTERENRLDDDL